MKLPPPLAHAFFLCVVSAACTGTAGANVADIRGSLVRILVTSQTPDLTVPWNPGRLGRGVSSGFIIAGRRIMTNAHVVSNARYITVEKDADSRKYTAQVLYIAHDCDLAVLGIEDPVFFDGTSALEFGSIPELHSTVTTYGYPIGGDLMSVTRGVVSRIEFRTYSHSGVDSHLSIQIDAAINPGNSGGPVMQEGRVVGVAFQGYSGAVAQNTGYMIPTPVIDRFLKDIADGTYDGYVELGVNYLNLLNPAYRRYLELPDDNAGVVVTNTLEAGSAGALLQRNDILLSIDGYPITSDGHIHLNGDYVQMEEIVERKFHGDTVTFDILRQGRRLSVDIPLKGAWPYSILRNQYDFKPEFVLFAGLLFQPLSRNFLQAYKNDDLDLTYIYSHYVTRELYLDHPQVVILSAILPDAVNTHYTEFTNSIVTEINGQTIRTLADVARVFGETPERFVIRMLGKGKPIVIERDEVEAARDRIRQRYGVTVEQCIESDRS